MSRVVPDPAAAEGGIVLRPFRAMRPRADGAALTRLLCPPYDVISQAERTALVDLDPDNAVTVVAPVAHGISGEQAYLGAARAIVDRLARGVYAVDRAPALYVYDMTGAGVATRGLIGALQLRDPADGVVLPHEDVMAGPVADRLALMTATNANLEPIYLIYDGDGPADRLLEQVDLRAPIADATTGDGLRHRLWRIDSPADLAVIAEDLRTRDAVIADGHHRYATYRELQRIRRTAEGPGPWDYGLALLVSTASYGPTVRAIHRIIPGLSLDEALSRLPASVSVLDAATDDPESALDAAGSDAAGAQHRFAAVFTDGARARLIVDAAGDLGTLTARAQRAGEPAALAGLDVTVLHRVLVTELWGRADDPEHVGYAHDAAQAVSAAQGSGGIAVLLRPTAADTVIAVARAGSRMPRKSTSFMPKPASGLVMRRFADEPDGRD